jgi:hypothetical protein
MMDFTRSRKPLSTITMPGQPIQLIDQIINHPSNDELNVGYRFSILSGMMER